MQAVSPRVTLIAICLCIVLQTPEFMEFCEHGAPNLFENLATMRKYKFFVSLLNIRISSLAYPLVIGI